jgi:hypothetical protein
VQAFGIFEGGTSLLRFARSLLETALNANVEIHARGIDDLYTFPLEVNVRACSP